MTIKSGWSRSRRICQIRNISQTAYLANLATKQAQQELLDFAVEEYLGERASISELVTKTGIDVTTLMDAIASQSGRDQRAVDAFLCEPQSERGEHDHPSR